MIFFVKQTVDTCLVYGMKHIDRLDAELLLAFVIQKKREYVLTYGDAPLSFLQTFRYKRLIKKRIQGIPLAYLIGHKGFFGLDFLVNKHTLIPRPDTELMVELVVERIKNEELRMKNILLIDIGTGSGCIPIAIKKTIEPGNNGTIQTFASDISHGALRIARKNAKKHQVNITFLHGNLLEPINKKISKDNGTIEQCNTIILTANLPYLTQAQFDSEPSIQHEPHSALVAANNGIALYEELLKQIVTHISLFPCFVIAIFFEIDPSQSSAITKCIQTYFPQAIINIKKDLAGQDRVVMFEISHQ